MGGVDHAERRGHMKTASHPIARWEMVASWKEGGGSQQNKKQKKKNKRKIYKFFGVRLQFE